MLSDCLIVPCLTAHFRRNNQRLARMSGDSQARAVPPPTTSNETTRHHEASRSFLTSLLTKAKTAPLELVPKKLQK